MLKKIITVIIETIFPSSHLQIYLRSCSQIEFESKLTPRLQKMDQMFHPFYYKDIFVRDCIFELKERNYIAVARLFGQILSRWIIKKINDESLNIKNTPIYLVPVPQHISKTKEKGFCHTTTLTYSIYLILKMKYPNLGLKINKCVVKNKKTKLLHNTNLKRKRFKTIKNTMKAFLTKEDSKKAYFFIIDDVFTTGATFKEVRRSLSDCAVPLEHMFFISIAH